MPHYSSRRLRADALSILNAALKASNAAEAVRRHVRLEQSVGKGILHVGRTRLPLNRFDRIFVVGAGKASASMAMALERILGPRRISSGFVTTKYGHGAPAEKIEVHESGHPMPDAAGVAAARRITTLLENCTERDLVFVLISGGASALLPAPAESITLKDKQATTDLLLKCGANIYELNAVRKHLSSLKGGQLAALASPATVVGLLLSDVIGDPLDVIGSGPTAPDASTFADAKSVLEKYSLWRRVPATVRHRLQQGVDGKLSETPKPADLLFRRVHNVLIGSNRLALDAAKEKAQALGYRTLVLSSSIQGETRDVASMHAQILREAIHSGQPVRPPACILSGGETTVTIRGKGKGGRNQEFVLAAALEITGLSQALVLSAGTDGTDGPTDAAGALADGSTLHRASALGLSAQNHLTDNNAYPFFDALGDLIRTGPTHTNVMDLHILLASS